MLVKVFGTLGEFVMERNLHQDKHLMESRHWAWLMTLKDWRSSEEVES